MRRRRKPLPSEVYTAEIVDLAHDGRGVARVDGKATFIDGALPGERVRYVLSHRTRDVDEGRLVGVDVAAPDRVEPACVHFGLCGGCALQHLAPAAQVAFKQKQMLDALQRIGSVRPETLAEPVLGPLWAYRRRARLGVKYVPKKGGVLVGFRERDSALLTRIDHCAVLDPRLAQALGELAALIGELSIKEHVPQIEVACAEPVALVLRVMRAPTTADRQRLLAFAQARGFEFYLQSGGPDTLTPLAAATDLRYTPDGSALQLHFGPLDFVQVNDAVSRQMVLQALDWLAAQPGDAVLELFCGLGNFTAPLAARGALVTAVEGDAELVRRGGENLARNGLQAHYVRADLFAPDAQAPWLQQAYAQVLLDPPRAGAREILPFVAATRPQRIVYVSCHPGTLARDAGALVHTHGYRLQRAGILDMFPHTAHVESMALFVRC